MKNCQILIIDDDTDILLSAKMLLKPHVKNIIATNTPTDINNLLSHHDIDIILLDMNFQKGNNDGRAGLYWLEHILSINSQYIVILMTAYGAIDLAVKAIKFGAFDFILKPWDNPKLLSSLHAAATLMQSNKKLFQLENSKNQLQNDNHVSKIIGQSESIKTVKKTIQKVAPTDANLLILGENGTGKQVFAYETHLQSKRKNEIFMHVDLGALNENLFESELFGYAKGAFTDAKEDKAGRFELADGGTLFLDEIGNLSLPLQSKLLSVLENRAITRLGESKVRSINIRLITATNAPIEKMVKEGTFREDLLYRINTVALTLPPLRERKSDIHLLAQHFIQKYGNKYHKNHLKLNAQSEKVLVNYHFPGNIRELQHIIERAVILAEQEYIHENDLKISSSKSDHKPAQKVENSMDIAQMEKLMIQTALQKHQHNISKTAHELGLTRAALYRRMEKFDL